MTKKEIDSIINEYSETEMIKKSKILNLDNKNYTLVISTGQVVSSFSKVTEFRKWIKIVSKKRLIFFQESSKVS
jgi:hypothetical protein